MDNTAVY